MQNAQGPYLSTCSNDSQLLPFFLWQPNTNSLSCGLYAGEIRGADTGTGARVASRRSDNGAGHVGEESACGEQWEAGASLNLMDEVGVPYLSIAMYKTTVKITSEACLCT